MKDKDIIGLVKKGTLRNELEYESALSADRTLRLMAHEYPEFKALRKKLRDLIEQYEEENWYDENKVTDKKIEENDLAQKLIEHERRFVLHRKQVIKTKLDKLGLKQKDLSIILSHSKSYTSELLNGIRNFSYHDLILIHKLFNISLEDLFLATVPFATLQRIKESMHKISKEIKLKEEDMTLEVTDI